MKKLIMLYFFLAGGIAANAKNIDYTYLKMQSAPFEVDDDYLSKHDIVYFHLRNWRRKAFRWVMVI